MLERDGLAATRAILTLLSGEEQPLITAVTAYGLKVQRERGLAAGIED